MAREPFPPDSAVAHPRFGDGEVISDRGNVVFVQFRHGIEGCRPEDVELRRSVVDDLAATNGNPIDTILKGQAAAIRSVNDTWGVFSRTSIDLLPHQLWVCRVVTERWPTRWLIADDVGLGKTIEAGLILWPLLAQRRVNRLLIVCPASLVTQWQYRLREMFDIRVTPYHPDLDGPRADFWNSHSQVIVSLQTARLDHRDRKKRLLESDPWDMVIVDEAHHLNADEHAGPTLGYRLIRELDQRGKIVSMVFFTGTPHRGKDYGFWSLLELLRPELFQTTGNPDANYARLPTAMIRNNKQQVTDLRGRRLFRAPRVRTVDFRHSPEETAFLAMLTSFIESGRLYASTLEDDRTRRAVGLVLSTMQKLASSSTAAVRAALVRRRELLKTARVALEASLSLRDLEVAEDTNDFDALSAAEEEAIESGFALVRDEIHWLDRLIEAADCVLRETKLDTILDLLNSDFRDRQVVLFTEYKATQAALMNLLIQRFGSQCVVFINGDDRVENVQQEASGRLGALTMTREEATRRFREGKARFLVSTEAGGEGIDLQENCHTLIHVDMPWNPMRLHQRVGRLNRYGQTAVVDVAILRNPETVESRIWELMDTKLERVVQAFSHAMESPEDLKQLVLGMTSPQVFREVFANAPTQPGPSFDRWFDKTTARFGGHDVVTTVRSLIGHVARFNYANVSQHLPQVDLIDLAPFLQEGLRRLGRRMEKHGASVSFITPEAWRASRRIPARYESLSLERQSARPESLLGIGHPLLDSALEWASNLPSNGAQIPRRILKNPLVAYRVTDEVTTETASARSVVVGATMADASWRALHDWEVLRELNSLTEALRGRPLSPPREPISVDEIKASVEHGADHIRSELSALGIAYIAPKVTPVLALWPHDDGDTLVASELAR